MIPVGTSVNPGELRSGPKWEKMFTSCLGVPDTSPGTHRVYNKNTENKLKNDIFTCSTQWINRLTVYSAVKQAIVIVEKGRQNLVHCVRKLKPKFQTESETEAYKIHENNNWKP